MKLSFNWNVPVASVFSKSTTSVSVKTAAVKSSGTVKKSLLLFTLIGLDIDLTLSDKGLNCASKPFKTEIFYFSACSKSKA